MGFGFRRAQEIHVDSGSCTRVQGLGYRGLGHRVKGLGDGELGSRQRRCSGSGLGFPFGCLGFRSRV